METFKNVCNKTVPCTIYPDCSCPSFNYKKILCRKFPYCSIPTCVYAHEELAHKYRTKMCRYTSECKQKRNCPFAHKLSELRTSPFDPIPGHLWNEKYHVFERQFPLYPELRIISKQLELIHSVLERD